MKSLKHLMSRLQLTLLVAIIGASLVTVGCSSDSVMGPSASNISDDGLVVGGRGGGGKTTDTTTTDSTDATSMDGGGKHAVGKY